MSATVTDRRPAGPSVPSPSRPRARAGRWRSTTFPYLLLAPALAVLAALLGYPLYRLGVLSVQEFGMAQIFGQPADFVGLDHFRTVLGDPYLWTVLARTLVFAAVNVGLTMGLGLAIALLIESAGRVGRVAVSSALVLAWAMPALTSTVVWQWIFDTQYGLANWALDRPGHSWLADPRSFFGVATLIVVWMGLPFVALTLYAGLTQIPESVVEAAVVDGAGPWQRFRSITLPLLKPVLVILTALSVVWDVRVFTQIYVLQRAGGVSRDTNLLGVYAYRIAIGENRFGEGAAVALIMVALILVLSSWYLRSLFRSEDLT